MGCRPLISSTFTFHLQIVPPKFSNVLFFNVHVEVCSEEISLNSLVWHYYLWPKTPQNSTVVFVMCKNITFFACLGLGLANMQGFRFRIGTLPLWSRILPTNEKLFKKFENGRHVRAREVEPRGRTCPDRRDLGATEEQDEGSIGRSPNLHFFCREWKFLH